MKSSLEEAFDGLLEKTNLPVPEKEIMFAKSIKRRWRFDRAWVNLKIAVELEGGIWSGGRHTRGKGYESDCEKYNTAASMGWIVIRLTSNMLKNSTNLEPLIKCIERRNANV